MEVEVDLDRVVELRATTAKDVPWLYEVVSRYDSPPVVAVMEAQLSIDFTSNCDNHFLVVVAFWLEARLSLLLRDVCRIIILSVMRGTGER